MTETNSPSSLMHVAPLWWYAGMGNSTLQILLHGTDYSSASVELVDAQGVTIKEVLEGLTSPNYQVLYLDLSNAQPQTFTIKLTFPDGRTEEVPYELKAREMERVKAQGFDHTDVIYLLMPDRFANGDPSNDVVEGLKEQKVDRAEQFARHGGDIQGIVNHLDYFTDLGVTALWLTPVQINDMPEASYHGYSITDYYQIDPRLGSNESYRQFVDAAHAKGLKVIMDMVFNHCGAENYLYTDCPSKEWFNYNGEYHPSSFKIGSVMDPYNSFKSTKRALHGWFDTTMPDINQDNEHMWTYLTQSSIWWMEYAGIDGIRQDTYPYGAFDGMSKWCAAVMEEYPSTNITGETWFKDKAQIAYFQKDSRLASPSNTHLPVPMDFPLMDVTMRAFDEKTEEWDGGLHNLYEYLSNDYLFEDPNALLTFLDNHDTSRFVKNDKEAQLGLRFKQAITFLLTTRGIPQIYYGTEIMMPADKNEGDGNLRRDFAGGWEGDKRNYFDYDSLAPHEQIARDQVRTLLQWRKGNDLFSQGELVHLPVWQNCYIYQRRLEDKSATILMNGTDEERTFDVHDFDLKIPEQTHDLFSGNEYGTQITIPAHDVLVLLN